jgi:hypothetical protein
VFRRRATSETTDSDRATSGADPNAVDTGKGRPTPSRKEAEAARRDRAKPPMDKKTAARADRDSARVDRLKQREAMFKGDEAALGPRDKGPVRRFARAYVDSRYTLGEYMLPFVVVFLVLSFVPSVAVRGYAILTFYAFMVLLAITTIILARRVAKEAAVRYPNEDTKGLALYAAMRSMQLRRMRLPRPQVARGERP